MYNKVDLQDKNLHMHKKLHSPMKLPIISCSDLILPIHILTLKIELVIHYIDFHT